MSFMDGWQGLICTKRVHLGLSDVAFIEECPHVGGGGGGGGFYEGFHCNAMIYWILLH